MCPPPVPDTRSTRYSGDEDSFSTVKAEASASPSPVVELPPALQRLDLVGTADDPYNENGPWAYAKEHGGTCFFVTTNANHESGRVLLSEEHIERTLAKKGYKHWAWILHDKDEYSAQDARTMDGAVEGRMKAVGYHVAILRKSFASIAQIAQAFGVPPEAVEPKPPSAFMDLVEYLTHENPNQQAKGKHLYGDDEVHTSPDWDWRAELEEHKLARSYKAGNRANAKKVAALSQAINLGEMTLRQVREDSHDIWCRPGMREHFQKLRGDYLAHLDAPEVVMNFYVFGEGGTGKDLLAKALARSLAPDAERPYFKVGGESVSWEGYDGEQVVIWEDMRVGDMLRTAKSRGMLFRILGPWREPDEKPIVNIKHSKTQLLNRVNIVTGPQNYEDFLKGLAGEYESFQGGTLVKHEAENLGQGFRRFPLIIPVGEREFGIYVNLGVLNGTREYQSYEKYEGLRQDFELLNRRCKAIKDAAERERVRGVVEAGTVARIVEQHDRIARPPLEAIDGDDLLAEFANVGQPVEPVQVELTEMEHIENRALTKAREMNRPVEFCTPSGQRAVMQPDGHSWSWVGCDPWTAAAYEGVPDFGDLSALGDEQRIDTVESFAFCDQRLGRDAFGGAR